MNTDNNYSAQQTQWLERQEHDSIMQALEKVKGYLGSYFYINGYYCYWNVNELPEGEPERIAGRGNHEEILFMIHQYGKTRCDHENYKHGQAWSSHNNESGAHLSDDVQRIILERNDPEEVAAYLSYWGFGLAGQDIILERGDHEEIMTYLEKHGFGAEQQYKLWARGNVDEMKLHIKNHGCCNEMLTKLFDKVEKNEPEGRDAFLQLIELHELPIPFQMRMLEVVDTELFLAYINRYGLWNAAHFTLICERSMPEVKAYIDKHHFLSYEGERQLIYRHQTRLTKYYLENRINKGDSQILTYLLDTVPFDREAAGVFFLNYDNYRSYTDKETLEFLKNGERYKVVEYVEEYSLHLDGLAALFFREDDNLYAFDAYIKRWGSKVF